MSQVAFARQEGLSQAVLSYWLCKYREEQGSTEPGFAAVTPGRAAPVSIFRGRQDENGSSVVFARLLLPDGAELHFHQSVPGVYLREVLGW